MLFCAAGASGVSAAGAPSYAASDTAGVVDQRTFSISSQPLETALMIYARTTGVEVFVDHDLVAGRRSRAVQGVYGLEAALRQLLAGTSLDIRRAAPRAYTLVAMPEPPLDRAPGWSADQAETRFFTALQAALRQSLCARPEIKPGQYRVALALWIDSTGRIIEGRLLGEHVDTLPSPRFLDSIKGIAIGQPPPADLQQPVTIVILPRSPDQSGDCGPQGTDHQ